MRKKMLFYTLCLLSAFLSAVMVPLDILGEALSPNIWIYANLSFIVGTFISFVIVLFLLVPYKGKPLGRYVDPNFVGLTLLNRNVLRYFVLMAIGNTIASAGYFYILYAFPDPSAILPFMQLSIIYLILGEVFVDKEFPTVLEVHSVISILFGALLASISPSGVFDLCGFLIVLVLVNGGTTITVLAQKKVRSMRIRDRRYDSINIRLWYLFLTTPIFLITTYLINPDSVLKMFDVGIEIIVIVVASMLVTFFAKVAYIRALGIGKASITQAITSASVILGIPFAIIGWVIMPDIFAEITLNSLILLIKAIGAVLVTMGIISLALSEVKAIILIRAKPGFSGEELMKRLAKIRGTIRISALAGKYDYLICVKIRTLGKGYRLVVRELERVEGIEDFIWLSTLYEWEEI